MSDLSTNLQKIYTTKLQIKEAIGTSSDVFEDYPTYIAAMSGGSATGYTSISSNGQYDVASYAYAYVSVPTGGGTTQDNIITVESTSAWDSYFESGYTEVYGNALVDTNSCNAIAGGFFHSAIINDQTNESMHMVELQYSTPVSGWESSSYLTAYVTTNDDPEDDHYPWPVVTICNSLESPWWGQIDTRARIYADALWYDEEGAEYELTAYTTWFNIPNSVSPTLVDGYYITDGSSYSYMDYDSSTGIYTLYNDELSGGWLVYIENGEVETEYKAAVSVYDHAYTDLATDYNSENDSLALHADDGGANNFGVAFGTYETIYVKSNGNGGFKIWADPVPEEAEEEPEE